MKTNFMINKRIIGSNQKPYVIAEMSANHNGDFQKAKEIIRSAKNNGANAIKIQTYTADTMTIDTKKSDFKIKHGLWKDNYLYNLYKSAETPFEWQKALFDFAKDENIILFSSAFDEKAVDLLQKIEVPAYKIASFEITDPPLVKYIALTGKPILLSTGMSSENEIAMALDVIKSVGNNNILLFHCISSYPANLIDSNLTMIKTLQNLFNLPVGLSDHTIGNQAAIIATALGACAIEKHYTLSRKDKGPDSSFSIEPDELRKLTQDIESTWKAMGNGNFERAASEKENKIFRRSIYFVKDLKSGDVINKTNIRRIRPGFAMDPKDFDSLLGRRIKKNVDIGDRVTWDIIEK